ncbi:MAG: hypothetical protein RL136_1733 [Planctomycetota bacterium]
MNRLLSRVGSAVFAAAFATAAAFAIIATPAVAAPPKKAAAIPDFTKGDPVPEGMTHDWNLGPTGARGWIYSNRMETSEARQILVTKVDKSSPADGVLEVGDVILGIGRRAFSEDPRTEFGRAIGEAEAADGKLTLLVWRAGAKSRVVVPLEPLGAYAATAPFDCPKSKRVLDAGLAALARRMQAKPSDGNPIVRCYNALALLASGDPEYLPIIRTQVEWASRYTDPERRDYHSWYYGPINMLLAEYTLATGDATYLPELRRITMEIVRGQSAVGSWGHRFVQENGRLAGYGMMNAPGLPLAISLVLAREAGVADPALDVAIARTAHLVRFYVGKGSVPYGDHHPWIETHDDNGKNGSAAVLFDLLGESDAAIYFSRMCVASHGGERDQGHTGNFFNMLWALPGVARSGPQATGAWMREFGWYYDLARRWDGGFIHQGPPEPTNDSYPKWDASGAYLLGFAQTLGNLRITRKGSTLEAVDAATARRLVEDGRGWSARLGLVGYEKMSEARLLAALGNWSPVVRERAATELARRKDDCVQKLVRMLERDGGKSRDLDARIGACQALAKLGKRASAAVPALRETLRADDLWLRIKAADALAAIGDAAMPVLPDLLAMLAERDVDGDPRGMQQRYLCFALFERREGLIGRSLEGVDREALYAAVRAGLLNEDGRARGSIGTVYRNLSRDEIAPLLPAIHAAVVEPAPSGIMFADGIRTSGLEILAQHRIAEGLPMCIDLIEPSRWGLDGRIDRCLAALRAYGGAAKSELPRLRELERELVERGWKDKKLTDLKLGELAAFIESAADGPPLVPLATAK